MDLEERVELLEATVERQTELIQLLLEGASKVANAATTALNEGRFTSQAVGMLGMILTFATCPLDQDYLIGQLDGLKTNFDGDEATVAFQNIGVFWKGR